MAATPDQSATAGAGPCPTCGAAMSPDQRYCLSCGARRGAPRVAPDDTTPAGAEATAVSSGSQRPADVSPLAAVIGIALLGGMLLIGVLIGRSGSDDSTTPAPVVQVQTGSTTPTGSTTSTTTAPADPAQPTGAVTTDWPAGQQ